MRKDDPTLPMGGSVANTWIGRRISHYDVAALVGQGGMGAVYRARDTKLGRDVAIKVLPGEFASDPDRLARFAREATTLATLNHPNIAHVHGLEESNGIPALVMEFVDGPTLAEKLRGSSKSKLRSSGLPLAEAVAIARQIAAALEASHEKRVVHRDLKPGNVMITPSGLVKVLDFGLAKSFDSPAPSDPGAARESELITRLDPAPTSPGLVVGTPSYMSPEQARGQPIDKRADIWAFGCVVFEMMTGHAAFSGATASDTIAKVLEREPTWDDLPKDTPLSLRRLIQRCLMKDPTRRLRDIGDALMELEEVRPGEADGPTPQPPQRARGQGLGVLAGIVGIGLAIAAIALRPALESRTPIRLSVVPPRGATFTMRDITEHPQFALSPDGAQIAFIAGAPGERSRIWVQSFESGAAQALAGTEDASGPFWAPDGQSLGFIARGKLRTISLDGAAAHDLADVAFDVMQGAWSADGVILFSKGNGGPLFRVPDGGGPITPATTLDESRNETAHRWPQFLPGSRQFVVFVGSTTPANNGIYLASLDSTTKTQLLTSTSGGAYVEPYLLFEQNGSLVRQILDIESGALTGQPEPTGDSIRGLRGPGYLPISSARNGTVAYWNGTLSPAELLWFDRRGQTVGSIAATGRHDTPVLSPDGTKVLAVLRFNANENELWRFDLQTDSASRLTFTRGVARFGIWAPDSQRIAFSAGAPGGIQLYEKAASGAGQETVIEGTSRHWVIFPDDWSRDGTLVYAVTSQTAFDVWALNLPERKARPILQTPANEVQPRLSPDGQWLAYASDESGVWETYVQGFGQNQGKWQVSGDGGTQPQWRRDGKELFFVGPDGTLFAMAVNANATFAHETPKPLFRTSLPPMLAPFRTQYAVSPDGQSFLINSLRPSREASAITIVLGGMAPIGRPPTN